MQISIANAIQVARRIGSAASIITDGLKMWLGFQTSEISGANQITPDLSGNSNVGQLFTGNALDFNGSTDTVDIDGFQLAGSDATFAFWINPTQEQNKYILDVTNSRFVIGFSGLELSIFSGAFFKFGVLAYSEWSRVAIVINGTSASCYVNGVQLGTTKTITAISIGSATQAAIGSVFTGAGTNYDGKLSDFQIYNAVWSADDIAYDYAKPNHLVTDNPSTSITVSNLKGYWALSEGAGTVAYDSSGEGINGTISGATYTEHETRIPQLGMVDWAKGSNLLTYSEDFSNAAWTLNGTINVTTNNIASPSGSITADKIEAIGTTSFISNIINGVDATQYTSSVFVKNIDSVSTSVSVRNSTTALSSVLNWSGSVLDSITNNTGVSTFTDEGNGWYRITSSYLSVEAAQRTRYNPSSGTADKSVYLWGAQLEESTSAGNYILTDEAAAIDVTTIQNPRNKGYDIFGNSLRLREHSFNLGLVKTGSGTGHAEVVKGSDFNFGTGDFTLEAWVKFKFSNTSSTVNAILGLGEQLGGATTAGLETTNNNRFAFVCGSLVTDSTAGLVLTEGDWYHVVGVRENSTVTLYVDAVNKNNGTSTANVTNTDNIKVGQDTSTARYYKELISDCRIYERALSENEILNNYNIGLPTHSNSSSFSSDFGSDFGG